MNPQANLITLFAQEYRLGAQHIKKASEYLVAAFDQNADTSWKQISELGLNLSANALNQLLAIGRGQIDQRLLEADFPAVAQLKKLDIALQRTFLDNGIEVFEETTAECRLIPVADLTKKQCRRVFGKRGIRTPAAQRTWLVEHQPITALSDRDYVVHKKFVEIKKPGTFSKNLVRQWLQEMGGAK